jgi:hypothetical protein
MRVRSPRFSTANLLARGSTHSPSQRGAAIDAISDGRFRFCRFRRIGRARDILASVYRSGEAPPSDRALFDAALNAYSLKADDAAALIDWCSR